MIIYIFNNFLHDNAGFSKRCRKEIEILSQDHDIHVICRSKYNLKFELFETKYKKVPVTYFNAYLTNNKRHDNYKFPVFVEILRTVDLFIAFSSVLIKVLWRYRQQKKKLYTIVSPLTIPFVSSLWGKLFNAESAIVEFHDLEPEMARHSKHLSDNSPVMRIEYLLERTVCRKYKVIIVTSQTQADTIRKRTNIQKDKILLIPNSLHVNAGTSQQSKINPDIYKSYDLKGKFVVTYVSSYNQDYTVKGIMTFIKNNYQELIQRMPNITLLIIGGGDGLKLIKQTVEQAGLAEHVIFTGRIPNISELLSVSNVCIVPWEKDQLSKSILPSKLFDYMIESKVIIAPDFGEFTKILRHRVNALLYNTYEELNKYIIMVYEDKKLADTLSKKSHMLFQDKYTPKHYESLLKRIISYD